MCTPMALRPSRSRTRAMKDSHARYLEILNAARPIIFASANLFFECASSFKTYFVATAHKSCLLSDGLPRLVGERSNRRVDSSLDKAKTLKTPSKLSRYNYTLGITTSWTLAHHTSFHPHGSPNHCLVLRLLPMVSVVRLPTRRRHHHHDPSW